MKERATGSEGARIHVSTDDGAARGHPLTSMRLAIAIVALSLLVGKCQSQQRSFDVAIGTQLNQDKSAIRLSWINNGSAPVLLTLGSIAGGHLLLGNTTKLHIDGPGLKGGNLLNSGEPAGIAGRIEPFVVCLPPAAEYSVKFETRRLILPGYNQTLADLHDHPWTVLISFIGRPASRFGPDGKLVLHDGVAEYGTKLQYWTGTSKAVLKN